MRNCRNKLGWLVSEQTYSFSGPERNTSDLGEEVVHVPLMGWDGDAI